MPTIHGRVLVGLLVLAGAAGVSAGALGASPKAGDSVYRALRYNDDFSYLGAPAQTSDPWDPVKYIPIGNGQYGPTFLSLGGEIRERFESYSNPNFGLRAPSSSAYWLHRLLLNADLHVTDYTRVFVQVG